MKHKAIAFIEFLLLTLALNSSAGVIKDSTASTTLQNVTLIFNEQALAPYNLWHQAIWTPDTMLNNLHRYMSHYYLGNTGLPEVPVLFNCNTAPLGFFYAYDNLTEYIRSDSSIRYYNTRAPYTSFSYVTDPQTHQKLNLYHTQNFGKKLNLSFEFHRTRSDGVYHNQSTNINQVALTPNYQSKRYVAVANILYNVMKFQQNGGITNDSDLTNSAFNNRETVPIYLSGAKTAIWDKSLHLKQYYFFGYKSDDTLHNNPLFYISHSLRVGGRSNVYNDPHIGDSLAFYPEGFIHDKTATFDSSRYNEFTNDISIGSGKGWALPIKWEAGVKQQWVHFVDFVMDSSSSITTAIYIKQYADTIFSNFIAHARLYNSFINKKLYFNADGEEDCSGNYKGDMKGMAEIGLKVDSFRMLNLTGNYSMQTPAFIYQVYDGNNFEWRNNFGKITTSTASLVYHDAQWHVNIALGATQITNLTYFTTNALAAQDPNTIQVLTASIEKDFAFRHWHWNTKEVYQQVPDDVPLRLPTLVAENSIFYQGFVFHHAMLLKAGLDVFYNTAFYAYAYMPVFNQYYVQNQTKLGGYVYLDPFVSFRIKTFRMFVKMENVGSGLLQTNTYYAYALHYPLPDRVLRFGISWDFWN